MWEWLLRGSHGCVEGLPVSRMPQHWTQHLAHRSPAMQWLWHCVQCQGFLCLPKQCIAAWSGKSKALQLMLKKRGWSWKYFRVEAKNSACSWIWSFPVIYLKCGVLTLHLNQMLWKSLLKTCTKRSWGDGSIGKVHVCKSADVSVETQHTRKSHNQR